MYISRYCSPPCCTFLLPVSHSVLTWETASSLRSCSDAVRCCVHEIAEREIQWNRGYAVEQLCKRKPAQGHVKSGQETGFASVTTWQQEKKEKEKNQKKRESQHRWRFDSVIGSLSPPTFTRCETSSRFYPGFIGRLCCENSIFLPRSEFLLNAQFWYYISNLHWWTQDNNSKLNSVSTLGWHFAHSVSRCSFRELSFVLITRSTNCKMSD